MRLFGLSTCAYVMHVTRNNGTLIYERIHGSDMHAWQKVPIAGLYVAGR
jgi:hypothetical protein